MRMLHPRRLGLCLASVFALSPVLFALAAPPKAPKYEPYDGKVVPLATVLEKQGVKLDPDAAGLALVGDDGKAYPLVKDDGARMFWKDERLLNRPMRLTGRVVPEVGMLQVIGVQSVLKGQLCDVYYWCDICSIRRSEKNKCDCCGGPLELREEPIPKK
jgi:hypothetical protein